MKILKFPDCVDPLKKIRRATLERDLICPFCGNKREVNDKIIDEMLDLYWDRQSIHFTRSRWKGQKSGKPYFFKWGKEIREWEKNVCKCGKCGGRWEGDPYPIDIGGQVDKELGGGLKVVKF